MIKVQLIVVQGRPEGKTITLAGPVFRVGRDETCHLRPSSDEVSRQHAEILITPEVATVNDLGSRNGTHLNGKPVSGPTPLKSGDLIKIGQLTFAVSIQGAPGAAPASKPSSGVKSLDEVGHEEVASWLIADDKHPVPERPSHIYDGDTISISAYKESAKASAPKVQAEPAKPPTVVAEPAKPPTVVAEPAKPVPEAVKPQPVVNAPVPAPASPPENPATPVAASATPAETPAASPPPTPPANVGTARVKTFWDEIESFEFLPEGEPEPEAEPAVASTEEVSAETTSQSTSSEASDDETPGEWVDESNPFYVAKKQPGNAAPEVKPQEAAKPSFKDSSDAANAILKKMLDRRKGGS